MFQLNRYSDRKAETGTAKKIDTGQTGALKYAAKASALGLNNGLGRVNSE